VEVLVNKTDPEHVARKIINGISNPDTALAHLNAYLKDSKPEDSDSLINILKKSLRKHNGGKGRSGRKFRLLAKRVGAYCHEKEAEQ